MVSSPSGRRGSSLLGRAHHQGGWGRLSDDRPGQHNPDSSEDPWGGGLPTLHGGASARNRPDTERDIRGYDGMHEGRKQTNTWSAYAGSRLELSDALGRRRPKRHPSSRTGENPPYGMIGGIEETSASFEARSAPRSYATDRLSLTHHDRLLHMGFVQRFRLADPLHRLSWRDVTWHLRPALLNNAGSDNLRIAPRHCLAQPGVQPV